MTVVDPRPNTFPTPDDEKAALCIECGHSLAGLTTSACPECGWRFQFNDRSSWTTAAIRARALREARHVPGALFISVAAFASVGIVVVTSSLGSSDLPAGCFGFVLLTAIIVIWSVRAILAGMHMFNNMGNPNAPRTTSGEWIAWLCIPVMLAASLGFGLSGAARSLRWRYIDGPAMQAAAEDALANPTAPRRSGRIGTISVSSVDIRDGRVHFTTSMSSGWLDRIELVYTPPASTPLPTGKPLGNGWAVEVIDF